jgi:invasion protein IalB
VLIRTLALALPLSLWIAGSGAPAVAGQPAQPVATYGSWSVECERDAKPARCAATQKVATDPAGEKVVLGVIAETARGRDARPQLTFRFTNRAFVPAGAGLKIDEHEPMRAPISACDDQVCEVRAWLTPELARRMRNGRLLVFAYFLEPGRQLSMPVSLAGFGKALDRMGLKALGN